MRSRPWCTSDRLVDHLAPVWHALPDGARCTFWCGSGGSRNEDAAKRARALGIPARLGYPPANASGIGLAVAVGDLGAGRQGAPQLRWVFGEHGCGLTYEGAGSSYLGSSSRAKVAAIVVPSERARAIQQPATPDIPVLVVGSSPKLDPWAPGGRAREARATKHGSRPTVAISFHFNSGVNDFTKSALRFYERHLAALHGRGWELLGHGHPRHWATVRATWERIGFEPVRDFETVLARADLYCVDNSSTLYEAAAAGIPVVALNCPRYRKDVHHGLRFWQHIPGLQCDDPKMLPSVIEQALEDPPAARKLREDAVAVVYSQHDGQATARWARAVTDCLAQVVDDRPRRDTEPFKVRSDAGELVESYATGYEAKTHAAKIGGTWRKETADGEEGSPVGHGGHRVHGSTDPPRARANRRRRR